MSDYVLVAAIDLGTTYSGWACSFRHEYKTDPKKIFTMQWNTGNHVSLKAPTTLLIRPDGETLEAFGYQAESRYAELADEGKHEDYYYFKRFKLVLHNNMELTKDTEISDGKGRKLFAMKVFSLSIRYLKDHLVTTVNNRMDGNMAPSDIRWVLTIPAIWNDKAKQFMRKAAEQAGIDGNLLSLALEPEVASMFCQLQETVVVGEGKKSAEMLLKPGDKYMVLDAGGGTVDITVHEIEKGGRLREVHRATGGDWGGTKVDDAFAEIMVELIGVKVLKKFKKENVEDSLEFLRDFELKKRDFVADKDTRTSLRLPASLGLCLQETEGISLKEKIAKSKFKDDIQISTDKMKISASLMREIFKKPVSRIVQHVLEMFEKEDLTGTGTILMVGGFSESDILQKAIREHFPSKRVITPFEAGLVVLKGAVVFGHDPNIMRSRVCKYTYGVETTQMFNPIRHPLDKVVLMNGMPYIVDLFDKHVEIGQTVHCGESQASRTYIPLYDYQQDVAVVVYASSKKSPMYVTDESCQKLGEIMVHSPNTHVSRYQRRVEVALTFSGTELEVRAKEETTGNITESTIKFLG
ncbi:hypothetical protein ACJMK2_019864 [Sinanodonta woodiana]|uniref:Heat shock 70 kDa protein n=1 Tax=Sinanodonta woodiana TaxID=1069815 RepID=A0ABD3U002_SINWO